jgi:hypothetical protein
MKYVVMIRRSIRVVGVLKMAKSKNKLMVITAGISMISGMVIGWLVIFTYNTIKEVCRETSVISIGLDGVRIITMLKKVTTIEYSPLLSLILLIVALYSLGCCINKSNQNKMDESCYFDKLYMNIGV